VNRQYSGETRSTEQNADSTQLLGRCVSSRCELSHLLGIRIATSRGVFALSYNCGNRRVASATRVLADGAGRQFSPVSKPTGL
jgi:hypothetical protein